MQKDFLKHSLIYTAAILFNRGISFFLLPIMTHYLHPSDYGTIDFITITSTFMITFCGLEIHQGVARFIVELKTKEQKNRLFSSALFYLICSYFCFWIIANIAKPIITQYIIPVEDRLLFNLVLLVFLCQGVIYYCSIILRFDLKPKQNVYLNSFTGLSVLLFNVLFVAYFKFGLSGAIYGLACGNLCGLVFGYLLVKGYLILNISKSDIKKLITFSYPLVLSTLSAAIMLYSDRIIIKEFLSLNDVGIFGVGYRFASIISIIMVGVQSSIGPLIYNSMNNPTFGKDLASLFEKFFLIGVLCLIGIHIMAKPILHLMVSPLYYGAVDTLKNMSVAIFFSQLYVFTPGMQINKKTKKILAMSLFGGMLNLVLCYFMVRCFGLNGASLASMVSYMIYFIVYLLVSQREVYIPYRIKKIIIPLVGLLAVVGLNLVSV